MRCYISLAKAIPLFYSSYDKGGHMPKEIFSAWNQLMNNITKYAKLNQVDKAQARVKTLINNLQKDFNKIVDQDIKKLKTRFLQEKREIEKLLNKTVDAEIKKAGRYVDSQKKELQKLQKKLEKYIKTEKANAKKKVKKKSAKKKTTKKATVKKKTTKKKTTKKS